MKIFLDSIDSFYSINHPQEQEKPKKKYSKNDERIGKISLVLIIAFVAYIIWTIVDAYSYGQTNQAYSQTMEFKTYTNNDDESPEDDNDNNCVHDGLTLCMYPEEEDDY